MPSLSFTPVHDSAGCRVVEVACGSPAGGFAPEEAAAMLKIVIPLAGTFVLRQPQGETVVAPGRAVFLGVGDAYRVRHPTGGGDRCMSIEVGDREWAGLADALGAEPAPRPTPAALDARTELAARVLARTRETLLRDELCTGILLTAAGAALRPRRSSPSDADAERLCRRAEEVIAARFTDPLSLADIARAAGCSRFHLMHVYRRRRGTTLHRVRTSLRVRAAVGRVLDGETNLAALALDLGFFDHAHMSNTVRREIGHAPRWLRKGAEDLARGIVQAPRGR